MKTSRTALGNKLVALRTNTGMAQGKAAKAMGIDQSSLCLYESGSVVPRMDRLGKIAEFYNVPVGYLTGADISADDDRLSGASLRAMRKELGLSQGAVAKAIGINKHSLCSYEGGRYGYLGKSRAKLVYEYLSGLMATRKAETKAEPIKEPEAPATPELNDEAITVYRAEIKKMIADCLEEMLSSAFMKVTELMKEAS